MSLSSSNVKCFQIEAIFRRGIIVEIKRRAVYAFNNCTNDVLTPPNISRLIENSNFPKILTFLSCIKNLFGNNPKEIGLEASQGGGALREGPWPFWEAF